MTFSHPFPTPNRLSMRSRIRCSIAACIVLRYNTVGCRRLSPLPLASSRPDQTKTFPHRLAPFFYSVTSVHCFIPPWVFFRDVFDVGCFVHSSGAFYCVVCMDYDELSLPPKNSTFSLFFPFTFSCFVLCLCSLSFVRGGRCVCEKEIFFYLLILNWAFCESALCVRVSTGGRFAQGLKKSDSRKE